jgi:signal transduction histidine kinase
MARQTSRPVGLWLLVAVALVTSFAFVGWRLIGASDGATIAFYGDAWTVDGVRVDRVEERAGGLAPGDLVRAIAGHPISEWLDRAVDPAIGPPLPAHGDAATYSIERDGTAADVEVTLARTDLTPYLAENWSNLLLAGVLVGLGLYVLRRRPELSAARALALAAIAAGSSTLPWSLGVHPSDLYLGWPFLIYALTVSPVYMLLWPAGALHLPLALMPRRDGAGGPSRRVLWLVYGIPLGGYALLLAGAALLAPSATAWVGTWPILQGLIVVPTLLVGLALALVAYRRASRDTQRQLRWALAGTGLAATVSLSLMFVPQLVLGRPLLSWSVIGLIALPMPIGLAVAIVRHRLFDIEVVVNRTLVYGGVTLAIVVIYASTVVVLGAVLPQGAGFPASLLATGLAAVAALPARDVLQRSVNRMMYGDRKDPYRALARLARRLESTLEPMAIPAAIVESVAEALRLPYVALEIGPPGVVELSTSRGEPVGETFSLPLVYGAEQVGQLTFSPRAPGESLSSSDRRLLDDLARNAGAAVHSVRLTLDVIRSRERLIVAREEERRRIRRDLHDGLGPTLAAIGMRAELAADATAQGTTAAEALAELTDEVRGALAEVRRLVEGLRPPALDELGLVGALNMQAERLGPSPSFDVSAGEPLPELPAAVEVAAYRIAVEAMTNAARHAAAQQCRVTLEVAEDRPSTLRLEITDDGDGLPARPRAGIGLASMRERADEVGGQLRVGTSELGGTTVVALLPIAATRAGG